MVTLSTVLILKDKVENKTRDNQHQKWKNTFLDWKKNTLEFQKNEIL